MNRLKFGSFDITRQGLTDSLSGFGLEGLCLEITIYQFVQYVPNISHVRKDTRAGNFSGADRAGIEGIPMGNPEKILLDIFVGLAVGWEQPSHF